MLSFYLVHPVLQVSKSSSNPERIKKSNNFRSGQGWNLLKLQISIEKISRCLICRGKNEIREQGTDFFYFRWSQLVWIVTRQGNSDAHTVHLPTGLGSPASRLYSPPRRGLGFSVLTGWPPLHCGLAIRVNLIWLEMSYPRLLTQGTSRKRGRKMQWMRGLRRTKTVIVLH